MGRFPVIKNFSYCLVHAPDLVRYGSKPRREIAKNPQIEAELESRLRSYGDAVRYLPNQTFLGNLSPHELAQIPRPWFRRPAGPEQETLANRGKFGEILDQETFYGLLKLADILNPPLFKTEAEILKTLQKRLADHPLLHDLASGLQEVLPGSENKPDKNINPPSLLPLRHGKKIYGFFSGDERAEGRDDENLVAHDLLENLSTKASAVLALKWLLHREGIGPEQVDFLMTGLRPRQKKRGRGRGGRPRPLLLRGRARISS